jgi:hypothetical protein
MIRSRVVSAFMPMISDLIQNYHNLLNLSLSLSTVVTLNVKKQDNRNGLSEE